MPEGWVMQEAARFWAAARGDGSFPRDVARAVPWALPLAVSLVPDLRLAALRRRLQALDVPYSLTAESERRLHGCLVAFGGRGLVFADAGDPEDERRYTVAHEVGHFVADYVEPRRRAVQTAGQTALDVLDGVRAPNDAERFRAALAGWRLDVHVHLLDRHGGFPAAESRADRLAIELLAPEDDALARLAAEPAADAAFVLRAAYGLPPGVAAQYARWLAPPVATVAGARLLRPATARRGR